MLPFQSIMYLRQVEIENIRSIDKLSMRFAPEDYAGWHVILGDNGSGKTTLIRAIALALIGPAESEALRQDWGTWLTRGRDTGRASVLLDRDPAFDKRTGKGRAVKNFYVKAALDLKQIANGRNRRVVLSMPRHRHNPKKYVWGNGAGWFSASYGPFRRFSGGNQQYQKLFYSHPSLAPHLSAFGEDVALGESLEWLQTLRRRSLEDKQPSPLLEALVAFVNEGEMLPHGTCIDRVTVDHVWFRDGNGCVLDVDQLSDGYRSMLSMTFELLRQLNYCYGSRRLTARLMENATAIDLPGVVMIDEVDAHLHPTWQRRVGPWFIKCFPNMQFIVTSHSPLVCHAAERGTIWQLRAPGEKHSGVRQVTGTARDRLLYGNVLDALDTELFGVDVGRSDAARSKLVELATLNIASTKRKLSAKERARMAALRRIFPTECRHVGELK